MNKTCVLIPVYEHPDCLETIVAQLATTGLDCLFVNDGSGSHCSQVMRDISQKHDWIILLERGENGGKGAAVKTGMAEAMQRGYTHVLQVDADGQHELKDIPTLLSLSKEHPEAVISGSPEFRDVPAIRYYGRYLTHVWVWINTLSMDIQDAMCGFRVYPLRSSLELIDKTRIGNYMDFDTEILVRLHWQGVEVIQFPTVVSYPIDGISHFRALQDNLLISWMHTRLFFGMLQRLPMLSMRLIKKSGGRHG